MLKKEKLNLILKLLTVITMTILLFFAFSKNDTIVAQSKPILYYGSKGDPVKTAQRKLHDWGYYKGAIDGWFGSSMLKAVKYFQTNNGLKADGVIGASTWKAMGFSYSEKKQASKKSNTVELLARIVAAEAQGEPYKGQVAVAAVILNRVEHSGFPPTISSVAFQPHALESVSNGLNWRRTPSKVAYQAARDALNGYDPTYGAIFFWNPSKPVSKWIWSRPIVVKIGNHVFAK